MRDNELTGCVGAIVLFLGIAIVLILVSAFLMTAVWGWVVPDVFAGAVEQGVLPASISLAQALKLSILLWIFGITQTSVGSSNKS